MRKQSPLTALFAVLLMAVLMFAADLMTTADAAGAYPVRAARVTTAAPHRAVYHRHYRRRRFRRRYAIAAIPAGDVWFRLRWCESHDNYSTNTGNGYYGAYQFAPGTWRSLGYSGLPHEAPPTVQDEAAQRLQARSGWGQWPACARRLGLR